MLELGNLAACISKYGINWEHRDDAVLGRDMRENGVLERSIGKTERWVKVWGVDRVYSILSI